MVEVIRAIFCDPPIAIARLGGSDVPLANFAWAQPPQPRSDGETVIVPDWTLDVMPDGSVAPTRPTAIRFRDGDLIRPVCPFIEVWARLGEPGSDPATWRDAPLTPALLAASGAAASDLRVMVDARNAKAARRTMNPDLRFGTFPPAILRGDEHAPAPLDGVSPPGAARPMVPPGRSIPLGSVRMLRSREQPPASDAEWAGAVNVEVVRLRFTPARGRFYGPPRAAQPTGTSPVPAVEEADAFLDPTAGWFGSEGLANPFVSPGDTLDELSRRTDANGNLVSITSLGVVDDTCEARIETALTLGGETLRAFANVFVGPPHYAPDRRPFLSLADEINDRAGGAAARDAALTDAERDEWVQDLFERIYEHVSLMNVDHFRDGRGLRQLTGNRLAPTPIPGDAALPADQALGSQDALRNRELRIGPRTDDTPLPMSAHARERHRALSDVEALRAFVAQSPPDRMQTLIRAAFEVEGGESAGRTTMRMPPFMRNSNALPLTLSTWQHALLMDWADAVPRPAVPAVAMAAAPQPRPLSAAAEARRAAVLRRLG